MRHFFLLIFSLMTFCVCAQTSKTKTIFSMPAMTIEDNVVHVRMLTNSSAVRLEKKQHFRLIPVLTDGVHEAKFCPICYYPTPTSLKAKRTALKAKHSGDETMRFQSQVTERYEATTRYEHWMENAHLDIWYELVDNRTVTDREITPTGLQVSQRKLPSSYSSSYPSLTKKNNTSVVAIEPSNPNDGPRKPDFEQEEMPKKEKSAAFGAGNSDHKIRIKGGRKDDVAKKKEAATIKQEAAQDKDKIEVAKVKKEKKEKASRNQPRVKTEINPSENDKKTRNAPTPKEKIYDQIENAAPFNNVVAEIPAAPAPQKTAPAPVAKQDAPTHSPVPEKRRHKRPEVAPIIPNRNERLRENVERAKEEARQERAQEEARQERANVEARQERANVEARQERAREEARADRSSFLIGSYIEPAADEIEQRNKLELNFTLDEKLVVAELSPEMLSLHELYEVAQTYKNQNQLEQFYKVIDTMVKLYPGNPIANLNAASTCLEQNKLRDAWIYMRNAHNESAEYKNVRGVYELLTGNTNEGLRFLKAAEAIGSADAKRNLETFFSHYKKRIENNR